ncbi:MAG: glycosyltransferase family 1 protein [Chloroflexi bacterium]|nr:glycosyltransferase family 1 protein [Chloroflexota bacterium]
MRVLCSAVPLEGHVRPLLPLSTALASTGHEVRFATGPDFQARVRDAGLTPLVAGPSFAEANAATARQPRLAALPLTQRGGATFSQVIAPAKLPALERIMAEWKPDLVVHECTDLAPPIAAAAAGVPAVTQGWGLVPLPGQTTPPASDVIRLWHARGLEPDLFAGIFGRLHLHPAPRSLQPEATVPVGRLQPMRLEMPALPDTVLPKWAARLRPEIRPVVYVTLGTHPFFNHPGFFRTILDGLATVDCEVVATTGEHTDPTSLGPPPPNVHLERWLPLGPLLARCNLVVCHGGSGTLLASLAAGLPLLMLPRGADQFDNAAACERVGVARVVMPGALAADAIADNVELLLTIESYRQNAARLRVELDAMPDPRAVVPLLEELALDGSRAFP